MPHKSKNCIENRFYTSTGTEIKLNIEIIFLELYMHQNVCYVGMYLPLLCTIDDIDFQ